MAKTVRFFEILGGPSREELFDTLRLFDEERAVPVTVNGLSGEREIMVRITGLAAKDGSGKRWLGKGFAVTSGERFDFYFDTGSRRGHITCE